MKFNVDVIKVFVSTVQSPDIRVGIAQSRRPSLTALPRGKPMPKVPKAARDPRDHSALAKADQEAKAEEKAMVTSANSMPMSMVILIMSKKMMTINRKTMMIMMITTSKMKSQCRTCLRVCLHNKPITENAQNPWVGILRQS